MLKAINDLSRHHHALARDLETVVKGVLESGWYINGPQVEGFEREFAAYCGVAHAVGVANGTDALEIALRALGVTAHDGVATVANAGGYATTAIRVIGASPIYVDVDPAALTMSAQALERALQSHSTVKAVVVTHLYGRLANIDALLAVARSHGIAVLEDCAQSHGACRNGKRAGSFGDIATFSFYPTKNLGALGDGGAVVTDDDELAARVKQLRQYGWSSKYRNALEGGRNSRLDELQAAILRVKLHHLDRWNEQRRDVARWYAQAIYTRAVTLPALPDESDVAHLYVLRTAYRGDLMSYLKAQGIPHEVHYPVLDPLQPAWSDSSAVPRLSVSLSAADEILTLPCFPEMTREEVDHIAAAINAWGETADGDVGRSSVVTAGAR